MATVDPRLEIGRGGRGTGGGQSWTGGRGRAESQAEAT